MSDRPILFSAPMVRAILAGAKTQTRRIVKDSAWVMDDCDAGYDGQTIGVPPYIDRTRCPYGQPGDRLWVRETWAVRGLAWGMRPSLAAKIASQDAWRYAADDSTGWQHGWKPSIHMPRAASRITLEITGVRVERLQEISHRDAAAEGWPADDEARALAEHAPGCADDAAIEWYADLWDSINGPGSWDANPWVWVVEFKRVTP